MLDLDYLREHADEIKAAAADKQLDPAVVDTALKLDAARRKLLPQVEDLRHQANQLQRSIKGRKPTAEEIEQGKNLKTKLKKLEPQLKSIEEEFQTALLAIPNPAASDVPVGKDENDNQVLRTEGAKPNFEFQPQTHQELLEKLALLDTNQAAKVAGSRAYYLRGDIVLLEQAVLQYALKKMVQHGFEPFSVPWLAKPEAFVNTGYGPWGMDDIYWNQDGDGLIGTAEVPLTAFYQDKLLREDDLPLKMVGISPCFRREVGSYGQDTQGVFRVHNFNKVEQVVYTIADEQETRQWHDQMLKYSEELLQDLGLHYQVLLMCTGDMGAGQRRKYDIEVWFPGQGKFRETHSDSYFNDFQARRLNIRYQAKDGSIKYVYTLNNTVAATPRLLAAIVENYQRQDGSIRVPTVLQPYLNKDIIG